MKRRPRSSWAALASVVLVGAFALARGFDGLPFDGAPSEGSEGQIEALYRDRVSDRVVDGSGTVTKVLSDDRKGSRHQRFVLGLASGHTLLVAHNIDLAPRIDELRQGDRVEFRGEYEWNERGGVLHWTHHDPDGRRPGGWLRHGGQTYR